MVDQVILNQLRTYIQQSITDYHQDQSINIFDRFIERCQLYYDQPAHTLGEIKLKMNKKLKGDIFEHFCLLYCQNVLKYNQVWLLSDVPLTILDQLKLKRRDFGIDLIAEDQGKYYAIQVKYRKHTNRKQYSALTWKQLSTFHALASRSGPYEKHIIITNADYCRQMGKKTVKDKSICYKTLKNIRLDQWMEMIGNRGHKITDKSKIPIKLTKKLAATSLSLDELRAKRLAAFT